MPMQVVYAREPFPDRWTKSVFLAGPTPRDASTPSWRPEALRLLEASGYDGVVFVPEDRDVNGCAITPENYEPQIQWEHDALRHADVIVFWVPRDLKDMPAFTTNIEWGEWNRSGKVALGYPKETPKMGYYRTEARWLGIPIAHTLEETLHRALQMIGDGAHRENGETCVPIEIWRTPHFQTWYGRQRTAGNRLLDAKVLWTYRIGKERERLFFWALETDMHVAAEDRVFKDGIVIGRPDVAGTVLFGPPKGFNTEVVLIREFRPAANTSDGYVHEPANGSSWKKLTPVKLAVEETAEETGVHLAPNRLSPLGERQLMPTLCGHRANIYFAQLTKSEMAGLKKRIGKAGGLASDGERTWIEIFTIREILELRLAADQGKPTTRDLDWSTIGMVLFAFYNNG